MPRLPRWPTSLRRELGCGRFWESEIREAYHALAGLPAEANRPGAHAVLKVHRVQPEGLHNGSPGLAHLRESIFVLSRLRELPVAAFQERGMLFLAGRR